MVRFNGCHCRENSSMHGCMHSPRAVGESSHLINKHNARKSEHAGDDVGF